MACLPCWGGVLARWCVLLGVAILLTPAELTAAPGGRSEGLSEFFTELDANQDGAIDVAEATTFIGSGIGGSEFDSAAELKHAAESFLEALDGTDGDVTVSVDELDLHLHGVLRGVRVHDWLRHGLGLPQYAEAFRSHSITPLDFPVLVQGNGRVLEAELGITSYLHRQKLVRAIRRQILGLGTPPSEPLHLTCASPPSSGGRVAVRWQVPADPGRPPLHRYVLERATPDGQWRVVAEVDDPEPPQLLVDDGAAAGASAMAAANGLVGGAAGAPGCTAGRAVYRVAAWNLYGRSPYGTTACDVLVPLDMPGGVLEGAAELLQPGYPLIGARADAGAAVGVAGARGNLTTALTAASGPGAAALGPPPPPSPLVSEDRGDAGSLELIEEALRASERQQAAQARDELLLILLQQQAAARAGSGSGVGADGSRGGSVQAEQGQGRAPAPASRGWGQWQGLVLLVLPWLLRLLPLPVLQAAAEAAQRMVRRAFEAAGQPPPQWLLDRSPEPVAPPSPLRPGAGLGGNGGGVGLPAMGPGVAAGTGAVPQLPPYPSPYGAGALVTQLGAGVGSATFLQEGGAASPYGSPFAASSAGAVAAPLGNGEGSRRGVRVGSGPPGLPAPVSAGAFGALAGMGMAMGAAGSGMHASASASPLRTSGPGAPGLLPSSPPMAVPGAAGSSGAYHRSSSESDVAMRPGSLPHHSATGAVTPSHAAAHAHAHSQQRLSHHHHGSAPTSSVLLSAMGRRGSGNGSGSGVLTGPHSGEPVGSPMRGSAPQGSVTHAHHHAMHHAHTASADGLWAMASGHAGHPAGAMPHAGAQADAAVAAELAAAARHVGRTADKMCSVPGCCKKLDLRHYRDYARRHYCGRCQTTVCGAHTAYSPHGATGSCGHESRCVCVLCFQAFNPSYQAFLRSRNTLPQPAPTPSPAQTALAGSSTAAAGVAGSPAGPSAASPGGAAVTGQGGAGASPSASKFLWARAATKLKAVTRLRKGGEEWHGGHAGQAPMEPVADTHRDELNHIHVCAALSLVVKQQFSRTAAAETLLDQLTNRFEAVLDQASAREVATVLWALAKLGRPPAHAVLARLPALDADRALLAGAAPQALANILWALGTWRCTGPQALLPALLDRCAAAVGSFAPQDTANVLWALGRLRHRPTPPVWSALLATAAAHAPAMTPQGLANSVWACSRLELGASVFLRPAAESFRLQLAAASPTDLALMATSLAALRYRRPDLMRAIAERCCGLSVNPRSSRSSDAADGAGPGPGSRLSASSVAPGPSAGGRRPSTAGASSPPAPCASWSRQTRHRLLWAFASLGYRHEALGPLVAALVEDTRRWGWEPGGARNGSGAGANGAAASPQQGRDGDTADGPDAGRGRDAGPPVACPAFIWSMARLGCGRLPGREQAAVMEAAEDVWSARHSAPFSHLAMAAWGLQHLGLGQPRLLRLAATRMAALLQSAAGTAAAPAGTAGGAEAAAPAGPGGGKARRRLSGGDLDAAVMLLWALGRAGMEHPEALEAFSAAAPALLPRLSPRQLPLVLCAYAQLGRADPEVMAAAAELLLRPPRGQAAAAAVGKGGGDGDGEGGWASAAGGWAPERAEEEHEEAEEEAPLLGVWDDDESPEAWRSDGEDEAEEAEAEEEAEEGSAPAHDGVSPNDRQLLLFRLPRNGLALTLWALASAGFATPQLMRPAARALGRFFPPLPAAALTAATSGTDPSASLAPDSAAAPPELNVAAAGARTTPRAPSRWAALLLWAFAAADCYSPDLYDTLLSYTVAGVSRLGPGRTAVVLWALALAGHHRREALEALCAELQAGMVSLPPASFTQGNWAVAHLTAGLCLSWRGPSGPDLALLAPSLSTHQAAVSLWALATQQLVAAAHQPAHFVAAADRLLVRIVESSHEATVPTPDSPQAGAGAGAGPGALEPGVALIVAEALALLLAAPEPGVRAWAEAQLVEGPSPGAVASEPHAAPRSQLQKAQRMAAAAGSGAGGSPAPQVAPRVAGPGLLVASGLAAPLRAAWQRAQRRRHPEQTALAAAARSLGFSPRLLRTHGAFPLALPAAVELPDAAPRPAVLLLADRADFASNEAGQPLGPLFNTVELLRERGWLVAVVVAERFAAMRPPARRARFVRQLLAEAGVAGPGGGRGGSGQAAQRSAGSAADGSRVDAHGRAR
ncbi:hypothetical protein HYH03_009357 [Edaphochlamys debaryana]|uniref:SAM domain-containing protein n=1 Tax=Edaphochlamys debaryana TaxID=47281 RepID=A0A836BYM9_9CHLO|nr:hypothetical protein HYH03_009357 [Edaphochlamys debaryana]|eukprot:KAG2492414.1 hypothetical protein HYH03_009357 [Edaphochlamys debaryana]